MGMDRWLAMHMAAAVAGGDWLGGWTPDYDSGPSYGYWLGLLYWLGSHQWLLAVIVQASLGAMVVPCIYRLGAACFSPQIGMLAAALTALYGPTIFYETLLVKFSLVPITVVVLLLLTERARASGSTRHLVAAGLAGGIFVALRSNALCVLPVLLWWLTRELADPMTKLRVLAVFALAAMLPLAPAFLRDRVAAAEGRGTSLWGIHFYIAAHEGADGTYAPVEGVTEDPIGHVIDAARVAEQAAGHPLTPTQVSLYWFRRGLEFARTNPLRTALLQLRKLRLALAGFEEGSFGDDFADAQANSWVLALPLLRFGTIVPLALLGMGVALGNRTGELLPAFIATFVLSLLPFFVTGRYRLPIVVPMLVLAAVGLDWTDDALRRGAYGTVVAAVVGMLGVSFGLPGGATDVWAVLALVLIALLGLRLLRRTVAADHQPARSAAR